MELSSERHQAFAAPPRQNPYARAYALAFDALAARPLTMERLCALGVTERDGDLYLPMLQHMVRVAPAAREVYLESGELVKRAWGLLALHYLCAPDLIFDTREVSLHHFDDCRGYLSVFQQRIVKRFLFTSGRTATLWVERAESLHGACLIGPGIGYRFLVLPRIPLTLVRHEADEEFGPDAAVLYQADIAGLLPAEDRVVIAELLLDALAGKPMALAPEGTLAQ